MDAFAVSITLGLSVRDLTTKHFLIPGIYFGFFQGLMPFIGYFAGIFFVSKIQNLDHWIAFILLVFIGGKMIKESFSKNKEAVDKKSYGLIQMLFLAVATSIDALAIGITFSIFKVPIYRAILLTSLTTFFISIGGVKIGNIFGIKYKSRAEFIGGLTLIVLGLKILVEHLCMSPV